MCMKRTVNLSDKALQIVEQYQQKYSCSFNKAVCDIITKFPESVKRVNKVNRELEVMYDIQSKVESVFQWVGSQKVEKMLKGAKMHLPETQS